MADFSKFSDGTNTYDVKDNAARAGLFIETTKCKPEGSWWEECAFIRSMDSGVSGDYIWSDGTNIYYSNGSIQYVLNKSTFTWTDKEWSGLTNFDGYNIWTDGTDIYYSLRNTHYVLNKSTSTWVTKAWSGSKISSAPELWTDGTDIYYSLFNAHYVLNKSTSTWVTKTWGGLTNFNGNMIWTDGTDIYYSFRNTHYVLNKSTSTWITKTWGGLTNFNGNMIWTDGTDIYYSYTNIHYVLNKSTSTWVTKTWGGLTNFNGNMIWTDGTDIYYSDSNNSYILRKFGSSGMDSYKNAITSLNTSVGTLTSLTTTDKTSLVAAVNEINSTKQPRTMSDSVSVGGMPQSTVEGAIGAIATKISKIDFDINRNLGTEITVAQKLAIANGTFEDLPIGAYWTLNGTVYRIAHHDYYLRTGDTECTSHHIVVVPDNNMYNAVMNDTNTTTFGYASSKMRTTNLTTALSTFEADFGSAHILNHRILITNAVSNGQASGWVWADSKVNLMSENMVYGHPVWGQSRYETGVERGQLALFSLYPEYIQKQRSWYWLRSVRSESDFCRVGSYGYAIGGGASDSVGVRPYAVIYFDDTLN